MFGSSAVGHGLQQTLERHNPRNQTTNLCRLFNGDWADLYLVIHEGTEVLCTIFYEKNKVTLKKPIVTVVSHSACAGHECGNNNQPVTVRT
jgi:hypothetical protein